MKKFAETKKEVKTKNYVEISPKDVDLFMIKMGGKFKMARDLAKKLEEEHQQKNAEHLRKKSIADKIRKEKINEVEMVRPALKEVILEIMTENDEQNENLISSEKEVMLVIGVNGVGKTTTSINLASSLGYIVIMIGLFAGLTGFIWLGIFLEFAILFFQLITLPVEFNASKRALNILQNRSILYGNEVNGAKSVLSAAAMTYVAAALMSVLQLVRLIAISNRNND